MGELTPRGQEAVRCAQATLLYPKCPQSIWYMETGVPNTVHGTGDMVHGTLLRCKGCTLHSTWLGVSVSHTRPITALPETPSVSTDTDHYNMGSACFRS